MDVLLELRIRSGVGEHQEGLHHTKRYTYVTLRLDKAKTVASSSQSPEVARSTGQQRNRTLVIFVTCDERNLGDTTPQYQLLRWCYKERPVRPRDPGKVRRLQHTIRDRTQRIVGW